MVDMFMLVEQSASMVLMVTLKLAQSTGERKKAASAAKVHVGKAGRFVGQGAVQIHGGIGVTDELALGHCFKRITMLDALYGNVDHHLARYASLTSRLGAEDAEVSQGTQKSEGALSAPEKTASSANPPRPLR
jgi:alkylation response protein AidB-like acyl-CoA dehydrogenase